MAINIFWELNTEIIKIKGRMIMSLEGLDFASEASPQVTYSDCLILSVVDWRGTLTRLLDHKDCEIISEEKFSHELKA